MADAWFTTSAEACATRSFRFAAAPSVVRSPSDGTQDASKTFEVRKPGRSLWLALLHEFREGRRELRSAFASMRLASRQLLSLPRRPLLAAPRLGLLRASAQLLCSDAGPSTSVQLTERCAARITRLADGDADKQLRLSVEPGGCSGFQYKFHLEDASELADDDAVIERSGAKLVVDEMSLELLRGATVDFEDDMMRSAFVVSENPMSEAACGCGTSFNPKPI
jgi:iron-sulfur cluster assembly accessory protein